MSDRGEGPWLEPIVRQPLERDARRFANLYSDCFDHHRSGAAAYANGGRLADRLTNSHDGRFFEKTVLAARFLEAYYDPPTMFESASEEDTVRNAYKCKLDALVRALGDFKRAGTPNRFAYLIGDVGAGKSLLATKVIQSLRRRVLVRWRAVECAAVASLRELSRDDGHRPNRQTRRRY
jgi:hypothetical protein